MVIVNLLGQVLYFGRYPCTKKTLPDFREWCQVTRHSRVFHGLTGCQWTPGNWGITEPGPRDAVFTLFLFFFFLNYFE